MPPENRISIILPLMAIARLIITIALIILCSGGSNAQTEGRDTTVIWDLEACLRYAREHNIRLNSKRLDKMISEQNLTLSRAARLPDLSGSATQFITGSNSSNPIGSGYYGLNSAWTVYRGGYLKYDIEQKDLSVASADLKVRQQENDIALQIMQYYLSVLQAKETIVYRTSVVSTSAAQVLRAKELFKAGSIAQKDVLQLEAQLANDKYLLVDAENAQRQDLIGLKQLLQLPIDTKLDIIKIDDPITPMLPEKLQNVRSQAMLNRPEIQDGQAGIAIAQTGLKKAEAGYRPTLTFSGYVGSGYSGGTPTIGRQLGDNFTRQAGLTLAVPIFTRKINSVNVAIAKIAIDQANLNLAETKTTLSLTIERVYNDLITAQSQYQAANEAFRSNTEIYRVANEQLKTGLINMVEYLQQKMLYLQALQQYLQAKYATALAYRVYNFYKGDPIIR